MIRQKPEPAKQAAVLTIKPESVRALQRRVKAFAATGVTGSSPVTYHR